MTLLSIVIPCWKDIDLLERLLNSIHEKTEPPFEVIVVESDTPEIYERSKTIPEYKNVSQIISMPIDKEHDPPQVIGHNLAVEKGLEVAKGDYLAWMDDDVVVSKDWWAKMKSIFETDPKIGVMSPMMYPRWDQYVLTVHSLPDSLLKLEMVDSPQMQRVMDTRTPEYFDLPINVTEAVCKHYWGYKPEDLARWDYCFEGFIVMTRKCYEESGAYSRNPSGGQEVNISRGARKKGFRTVAANQVHFYHCDSYPECIGFGRAFRRRGGRKEVI